MFAVSELEEVSSWHSFHQNSWACLIISAAVKLDLDFPFRSRRLLVLQHPSVPSLHSFFSSTVYALSSHYGRFENLSASGFCVPEPWTGSRGKVIACSCAGCCLLARKEILHMKFPPYTEMGLKRASSASLQITYKPETLLAGLLEKQA